MNSLGIWGIPGSFPTGKVRDYLENNYAVTGWTWTRRMVNDLYYWYLDALDKGKPIFVPGKQPEAGLYMAEKSKVEKRFVFLFLLGLRNIALKGLIPNKWYTDVIPDSAQERADFGIEDFIKNVKVILAWSGIILVGGTGLYVTWPLIMKGRKVLKR